MKLQSVQMQGTAGQRAEQASIGVTSSRIKGDAFEVGIDAVAWVSGCLALRQ